jgi:hypothetical protein
VHGSYAWGSTVNLSQTEKTSVLLASVGLTIFNTFCVSAAKMPKSGVKQKRGESEEVGLR